MPRQQSNLLNEEQAADFLPRRGSDQNLVCSFPCAACSSQLMQCTVMLDCFTQGKCVSVMLLTVAWSQQDACLEAVLLANMSGLKCRSHGRQTIQRGAFA